MRMNTKSIKHKILIAYVVLAMIIVSFAAVFGMTFYVAPARAAETYSNVLDDLQKDANFNSNNYPANATDYSLQMIQVAESSDKKLLAYVYQPSAGNKGVVATSIRMAVNGSDVMDYDLKFLSASGTLYKYELVGYAVNLTVPVRAYNIVQLARTANKDLGDTVLDGNNNTISTVPYACGRTYSTSESTEDGKLCYNTTEFELVKVTSKYVGQLRYEEGLSWRDLINTSQDIDSHFIAFSTNRKIDTVKKATIIYDKQEIRSARFPGETEYSHNPQVPEKDLTIELTSEQTVKYEGGLFSYKYEAKRIETIEEFIADATYQTLCTKGEITEEAKSNFEGQDFVIRFLETYREFSTDAGITNMTWYKVSDVSVMWLEFETDGIVYSLGVVDNLQTGDGIADNYEKTEIQWDKIADMFEKIGIILGILAIVIIIAVCIPFITPILNVIGKILKFIFKGIWTVICLPFKAISALFGSKKYNYKRK